MKMITKIVNVMLGMPDTLTDDKYKEFTSNDGPYFDLLFNELRQLQKDGKLYQIDPNVTSYFGLYPLYRQTHNINLNMIIRFDVYDDNEMSVTFFMTMLEFAVGLGDPDFYRGFSNKNPDELAWLAKKGAFLGDLEEYLKLRFELMTEDSIENLRLGLQDNPEGLAEFEENLKKYKGN